MADFGTDGNLAFAQFKDVLTTGVRSGRSKLNDQVIEKPKFWITITRGGSGYLAVMMWDGPGFHEPWDTGFGQYKNYDEAETEGRGWALEEGIEFI